MQAGPPIFHAGEVSVPQRAGCTHSEQGNRRARAVGRPLTARPGVVCEAIGWSSLIGYSSLGNRSPRPCDRKKIRPRIHRSRRIHPWNYRCHAARVRPPRAPPLRRSRGRRRRRAALDLRRSSSTAATAGRRALQPLGVAQGDRVAYIAPNTHAQLEAFYAVPQIGAVLVPINYRLIADDFAYIINHSGAQGRLRPRRLPGGGRRHPRASCRASSTSWRWRARATGWLDYEALLAQRRPTFERPPRSPRATC